jgi:hypothetical protein
MTSNSHLISSKMKMLIHKQLLPLSLENRDIELRTSKNCVHIHLRGNRESALQVDFASAAGILQRRSKQSYEKATETPFTTLRIIASADREVFD